MPDWLADDLIQGEPVSAKVLAVRLALSVVFGGLVSLVYRLSHGREKGDALVMQTTLILLCVLIAMVSLVIGDSVARAFSLVGALSIVRFRTVVDDTRDTAFVIFAVIVGMAMGTDQFLVAAAGIPAVGLVAIGLSYLGGVRRGIDSVLTVRISLGRDVDALLAGPLAAHVQRQRLLSVGTTKQGAALELSYRVRVRAESELASLVTALNGVEGIQGVELRRD